MIIEGTYTLQGPPEDIWRYLTDQELLSRVMPGAEQVERIDQDSYNIALSFAQGPFKGTHQTHITLSEQQYPYHYRLTVESTGAKHFSGTGSIHLQRHQQSTIIAYKGSLNTNRLTTFLTPKLLKGATKHLIQQYFLALAHELRQQARTIGNTEPATELQQFSSNEFTLATEPTTNGTGAQTSQTLLGKTIRLVRLGGKDPDMQFLWEKRIRRASTISGLLLLIWLGTKIPRRFS